MPKKLKHKLHLIPDKNCQKCNAGDSPWNPTANEKEVDKSLFRYKTKVIKGCMKPDQIQEYDEIDGILFYQGRIAHEN